MNFKRSFLNLVIVVTTLMLTLGVSVSPAAAICGPFQTVVIVRTPANFTNHAKVVAFMTMAVNRHVSIIDMSFKEDDDGNISTGYVYYPSAIAPVASGFAMYDAALDVITEAHARGIKVRAWVPQFHDKVAFDKNPDWQMYAKINGQPVPFTGGGAEYFVNPLHPDVQAYERSILVEIATRYAVDGIIIDWVRFDDFNMDVSPYTRQQYQAAFGYDPLTIDFTTDNAQRQQWQDWRTTKLAQYIQSASQAIKAVKPNLPVGVYVLPPEFVEVGQDPAKIGPYVDFFSPMAYYDDWRFTPSWIYNNVMADIKTQGKKPQMPAVDYNWRNAVYEDVFSNIRSMYPEVDTIAWFVFGTWQDRILKKIDTVRYY